MVGLGGLSALVPVGSGCLVCVDALRTTVLLGSETARFVVEWTDRVFLPRTWSTRLYFSFIPSRKRSGRVASALQDTPVRHGCGWMSIYLTAFLI